MVPSRTTREVSTHIEHRDAPFQPSHTPRRHAECSDLEADEAVAAVVAHVVDGHRPLGHHAAQRQSTAPGALKSAQRRPVHPSAIAAPCRNRCH